MRKHYIDNIRWITVVLVVIYHVIYMYNGVMEFAVIGPFQEVQYQDMFAYIMYPWFMVILFIISGMCARYYLEKHTIKEFIRNKTRHLLVPSTIGLFAFHWILGYYNMAISGAFETMPNTIPKVILWLIMSLSGTGTLWYIQLLWLYCMILAFVRKFEKGKLYRICQKTTPAVILLLGILVWISGLILNMPLITVYRFGIYGFSFFLGYFVFAHDNVVERLCKWWYLYAAGAIGLGIPYLWISFGQDYTSGSILKSPLTVGYGWFVILTIFAVMKKWGNKQNAFTAWMSAKNFGLYVFHYLPLAVVCFYMDQYGKIPAPVCYLIAAIASFAGGYLLYEIVSRIPVLRWCVLGIKKDNKIAKEKKNVS